MVDWRNLAVTRHTRHTRDASSDVHRHVIFRAYMSLHALPVSHGLDSCSTQAESSWEEDRACGETGRRHTSVIRVTSHCHRVRHRRDMFALDTGSVHVT